MQDEGVPPGRKRKGPNWKYITPLIYAPAIPLIRIAFRNVRTFVCRPGRVARIFFVDLSFPSFYKMHRRMLSLKPLSVSLFFCAVHLTQHESTATHPPCPPHPPLSLSSSSYFSTFISTETCHASKSNSGRGWLRTVPRCLLNYV